ncbi:MAG: iron uptake porin, partial [Synechococcaceae cyanobacterium SM2_3_1]|nr:iron uptake porin [Synechococcaceae cyanobacterium SM2_3_1]
MPANYSHHWKTLLAGALGAATVAIPSIAQAQTVAQASGPVTAISELSDVQPTDWAFQALQSLVERYGCIAGYPDRTYRGNRAMTRFEFAAGMNACLDRINELIAAGLADKVSREDLATLQRLQEEFAAELAALKGRVDTIEADVADLQSKVFNPVTKLNVQLITALLGSGLTEDRVIDGELVTESDQANITFPYRLRMNFDASFVGNDRLRVRLQARDANTDFFDGDAPGAFFSGGGGGNVG